MGLYIIKTKTPISLDILGVCLGIKLIHSQCVATLIELIQCSGFLVLPVLPVAFLSMSSCYYLYRLSGCSCVFLSQDCLCLY